MAKPADETGPRFKKIRLSRGVKASYVAAMMGILKGRLCMMEQGIRPWTEAHRSAYLKAISLNSKPKRKTN